MDMQLRTQRLLSCPTELAGSSAGVLKSKKILMPGAKDFFFLMKE
jgi:hypothetical protein